MSNLFNIENLVKASSIRIYRTKNDTDRSKYVRLDKNENLMSYTESEIAEIREVIDSNLLSNYYNLESTYEFIATRFECTKENVLLTAGADIAIKSIYETFVDYETLIAIPELAYGMHEVYSKQFSSDVLSLSFDKDFTLNLDALFECSNMPKVIFVESPSGVTGMSITDEKVNELALRCAQRNSILVVDETYAGIRKDFICTTTILENPNLISIRSFSKSFGLAGMRGGMILAHSKIISHIVKIKPMHELSSITAKVIQLLGPGNTRAADYQEFISVGLSQIQSSIDLSHYELVTGDANFYLIKPNFSRHIEFDVFVREHGILIRPKFLDGTLEDFFRVTIGSTSQNDLFLRVLKMFERL